MFTVQHTLDERLVQYLITEETLDVQHVLSLLCLVSKHHCILSHVLQEYFEINASFHRLFALFVRKYIQYETIYMTD